MAEWKITAEPIELFPHPNAEKLELAKVGDRQFVVQKGLYTSGQVLIAVPEKSVLPDDIKEPFLQYLKGTNKNRVGSCKLRGEMSEGILLNPADYSAEVQLAVLQGIVDLAELLNITQYVAPIPSELAGVCGNMKFPTFVGHDCDQFSILANKTFDEGGFVVVTEKVHGSQINILIVLNGLDEVSFVEVTSKGLGKRRVVIDESESNFYWRALRNTNLIETAKSCFSVEDRVVRVQICGEAVPIQKGFDYGKTDPTVLIYRVFVDGQSIPFGNMPVEFDDIWVPILEIMPIYADPNHPSNNLDRIKGHSKGMSKLSGHIKEGIVVSSYTRPTAHLKFISDAYAKKADGEEFS